MLFQNMCENILVRQKLKTTKQENHLINSIDKLGSWNCIFIIDVTV